MSNDTFFYRIVHGTYDKTTHVVLSCIVTLVGLLFMTWYWTLVIVLGLGIVKEIIDSRRPGDRFDLQDVSADILGIIAGLGLGLFLKQVVF